MNADKLPSILHAPNNNSLSMERALKQIHQLLIHYPHGIAGSTEDSLAASIDDIETMLAAIDRGD